MVKCEECNGNGYAKVTRCDVNNDCSKCEGHGCIDEEEALMDIIGYGHFSSRKFFGACSRRFGKLITTVDALWSFIEPHADSIKSKERLSELIAKFIVRDH